MRGGGLSRNLSAQGFTTDLKSADAFTLAEVLITLGIIGVVAALTMPALIAKYQEKALETQYAKAKTVLANGYKLMMAKKEIFKVENLPILNDCNSMTEKACMSKEHREAFNKVTDSASNFDTVQLPKDYTIQGKEQKSPFNWDDVPYIFVTTDGMTYGISPDEDLKSFSVVTDVNGMKNPNTVKKDLYKFRYSGNGLLTDVSSELESTEVCSVDTPENCKTEEACYALLGMPRKDGKCPDHASFRNNICNLGDFDTYYCR